MIRGSVPRRKAMKSRGKGATPAADPWLLIIFDAFEEICRRVALEPVKEEA